jgi:hypothetical protein
MSAPPGFNSNDSLLPDPGANSAPIHVMKGGGLVFQNGGFTPAEEAVLDKYQLGPGGILEEEIPSDVKTAFLQQIQSFENGSLNLSTLKKNQWAILQVIQTLLEKQRKVLRQNQGARNVQASASSVPPPNTEGLPSANSTPSGQPVTPPQTGGFDFTSLFKLDSSSETTNVSAEPTVSNVTALNVSNSYGATRKRRGGAHPKLRTFAKLHSKKTKSKRA